MGFFDRFKEKPKAPIGGYEKISALGNTPDAWDTLSDEKLKEVVMIKCIEYGASQDGSRIPGLFALYRYAMTRIDVSERMDLLLQFSAMTEERKGQGHMGLMMFLAVEIDRQVLSTAALNMAVLFDPEDGDILAGPKFVIRHLMRDENAENQGAAIGGILLLGDKRLLPLLEATWEQLSDPARLALTRAKSGRVSEAMVEFWLRCLENGCSESVYGSLVAALAKMPAIAKAPFVCDLERVLPVYRDSENPMRILRQTSFVEYLEKIRPRLKALAAEETEPKLISTIYEVWENPNMLKGRFG